MERNCNEATLVVGGRRRLPTDPSEYNYELRDGVGCNNLYCTTCDSVVRSASAMRLVEGRRPTDLVAMYEAADWSKLGYLKVDHALWRLYACKCSAWEEASEHLLINDGDSPGDPDLPWACDGHPPPALPVTLGELVIQERGTDWADVVRRVLGGVCARRLEREDEGPSRWLIWLRKYLDGLAVTADLSRAVADQLRDGNDPLIGAVLLYVRWFSSDPGVLETALTRAEADLGAVLVPHKLSDRIHRPRLWDVLLSAMGHPGDLRARVADVMRKVMLLPANEDDHVKATLANGAYASVYREDDLQWMAEHIVALDTAGPGRWLPVMDLLVQAQREDDKLGYLVAIGGVALIQSGRVPPAELRAWMARHGDSDAAWTLPLEAALSG